MSEQAASATPLYRHAMQAAGIGLVANLALGVIKLIGGIIGQSFALISDSVNSLGDSLASVVTLGALYYAQRPADAEHPYGHTRVETVAGAYVAILILISALLVGWEAAQRFTLTHGIPPAWTLWIAAGNVAIKEGLYWYKRGVSRRTGSVAILSTAWDHRSDALCSLAVLVGLAVVRTAGPQYIWADEAAALVVVVAILWTGTRLLSQCTHELLDPQADAAIVDAIRKLALEVAGVADVEKLWVRKTGLELLVDIHIEVDPTMTVEAGHSIGHDVKDRIVRSLPAVRDVLVHLEPYRG